MAEAKQRFFHFRKQGSFNQGEYAVSAQRIVPDRQQPQIIRMVSKIIQFRQRIVNFASYFFFSGGADYAANLCQFYSQCFDFFAMIHARTPFCFLFQGY